MTVFYRGHPVSHSVFNRKDDTYSLIDNGGEVVAELKRHEYMANPQLRTLENRSGRHRGASQKGNGRSAGIASDPWGDAADALLYSGLAVPSRYTSTRTIAQSPGPSLTAQQIALMQAAMQPQIFPSRYLRLLSEFEKPKPALRRDGIVAGEIVGYRCWRVEDGLLRSVYQTDVWKPGEVLEGRELGDWDQRGIHAWKDAGSKEYSDYIRSYLNDRDDPFTSVFFGRDRSSTKLPAMVTGTVFLWGDVVEHQRGWRAEFARVRSLDWLYPDETMMGREQQALEQLRGTYALSSTDTTSPEDRSDGR